MGSRTKMAMKGILIFSLLFCLTRGLFFRSELVSQCSRDSQCQTFGRTQCLKRELLFFCTEERSYTVPGKCVQRTNLICGLGNVLNGNRRQENCKYTQCANCLLSQDCGLEYSCRDYNCRRNSRRNFRRNRG